MAKEFDFNNDSYSEILVKALANRFANPWRKYCVSVYAASYGHIEPMKLLLLMSWPGSLTTASALPQAIPHNPTMLKN